MVALAPSKPKRFDYVREWNDEFLGIFPHRGDYLYAEHPEPGTRPEWKTESKHLLSDRLIRQGAYLYGVRFGSQTDYLMLDLDPTSHYHPGCDPWSIGRILEALELVGLVEYVAVQSSYRSGIHLYFPFEKAQRSWAITLVAQTLLENAGFKVQPGQLEIFPNPKPYGEHDLTLYNGHRLPLQSGSYLLDKNWEPTYSTDAAFVSRWKFAQARNDIDSQAIEKTLKKTQRKQYFVRGRAQKFLNDLNAEIEPGWTGLGQTNHLLGKIACRARVFHHVVYGGEPLTGEQLADAIVQTARLLPGFSEFCQHQHELELRTREYARAAEKRYYPYGSKGTSNKLIADGITSTPTWNQQQALSARERIRAAIADMLNQGTLPAQVTARFKALKHYGIGSDTLSKNRDLWDPRKLQVSPQEFLPKEQNFNNPEATESLQEEEFLPKDANKLVRGEVSVASSIGPDTSSAFYDGGSGGFSTGFNDAWKPPDAAAQKVIEGIHKQLKETRLKQESERNQRRQSRFGFLSHLDNNVVIEQLAEPEFIPEPEYVFERNHIPETSPVGYDSLDLSDLIAQIQVHVKRLEWTCSQADQFVADHFGRKSRDHLTDDELLALLGKLQCL
ncbi:MULTISPECIES: hypothetical protein [Trichocoleus]|uniref:hypothetical protein n=1 Tax=Trichocoleus TaxID=450526 RepID=UPI0016889D3E|nr:hypothetical protein [Trichocoleus sp. FACHB-262]MBD2121823.1 hypothetical protein [Trichocoleus sp. FACHB-262]